MKLKTFLGAIATLCLLPAIAFAQTASAPSGSFVPTTAPCYATSGKDSACIWVDSTHGLPVTPTALATGAATAANQTAVQGTAGSPTSAVLTIQGVSGGQPVPIAGTTANTVASSSNPVPSALYSTAGVALTPNRTDTDTLPVSATASRLEVNAFQRIFNGSTESRAYQIDATTASGTGVAAVATAGASFTNVTTATTTTIKSGAGIWQSMLVNSPQATTITCYANTSASGTKIGTWTTIASVSPYTIPINLYFTTGLTCVTANAIDLTFVYR